jgi:sec-independent protein translocase protein TatA
MMGSSPDQGFRKIMNTIAYFGMPGGSEVILILFIILLLFGAKKLPELSRSLGKSLGEFKKGKEDLEREIHEIKKDVQNPVHEAEVETESTVVPDDNIKEPSSAE